jgi:hypothetical protein
MNIIIAPGERLTIGFAESENDVFVIEYNDIPNGSEIKVTANLPDNSGHEGVIYHERSVISLEKEIAFDKE